MHLIFLNETHVVILTQSVEVAGELCSRNCPETQHDGVHDAAQMMSWCSHEKQERTYFGFLSDCLAPLLNNLFLRWSRNYLSIFMECVCQPQRQNEPDVGSPVIHEESQANQAAKEKRGNHRACNDSWSKQTNISVPSHSAFPSVQTIVVLNVWSAISASMTCLVGQCDIGKPMVPNVSRYQKVRLKTPGVWLQVESQTPSYTAPPGDPSGGSAPTRSPPPQSTHPEACSTQSWQSSQLPSTHSALLKLEELETRTVHLRHSRRDSKLRSALFFFFRKVKTGNVFTHGLSG